MSKKVSSRGRQGGQASAPNHQNPLDRLHDVPSRAHELRILIPDWAAGTVIGKGGSNITQIRKQNKITIRVPACKGPERVLSMSADDVKLLCNVLTQVFHLIEEDRRERHRIPESEKYIEIRLLLHHSRVGALIGTNGTKTQHLRETTKCDIKVFDICCPGSTDRVVCLVGELPFVIEAIKRILDLKSPPSAQVIRVNPYDPHNFNEKIAHQYGGFSSSDVSGGFGPTPKVAAAPVVPPIKQGDGDGPRPTPGTSKESTTKVENTETQAKSEEKIEFAQRTIPKQFINSVVGLNGSHLQKMRGKSGAKIRIEDSPPHFEDRVITVIGTKDQIAKALILLRKSVEADDNYPEWRSKVLAALSEERRRNSR